MADRGIGGTGVDDDLSPARAVVFGFIMGSAIWTVLTLFWWIVR